MDVNSVEHIDGVPTGETETLHTAPVKDDVSEVTNVAPLPTYSFGEKRKKKKPADKTVHVSNIIDGTGTIFVKGTIHDYKKLLLRIQSFVESKNPDLQGSKRYTIKPPQLARVGSKKVAWTNFYDICNVMQRSPEHVLQFVLAELGTEGSIGGDGQLTLKGKFGPKHIECLLRKYIIEYVTCSMCKSPNTTLSRDSSTRLFNINCSACGASRSVTTIRSGFHAVSRADRRKAKQAG